ncbi:hypothetical protein PG990_013672 [Apiospora arundinis]
MSIQGPFKDIPSETVPANSLTHIPNQDEHAMRGIYELRETMRASPPEIDARGSWGYTIYTPESDDLFPSAIAKLERWVREHHLHINRFPMFGEKGRAKHKSDGSLNDELARRFRVDLVQDENRLNLPRLSGASQDDIRALCDVFNEWVVSVGQDPSAEVSLSPRFFDCLVVDEDALRSLVALPEEPPQLHVAEECLTTQAFSPPPAHHPDPEGYVRYRRGWMKAEVG